MSGRRPQDSAAGDDYSTQIDRAREPFASLVEAVGFEVAVASLIHSARRFLEEHPGEFDAVLARGTRDEGAIWYAATAAEFVGREIGYEVRHAPSGEAAAIPARGLAIIAYRHP